MRSILAAALAATLLLPTGPAAAEGAGNGRLTVTGEGVVTASPDMAHVTLGAVAEDPQAEIAMAQMRARLVAITARLEAAGIAPRDMQTSGLSLDPRWKDRRSTADGAPAIETFVASSQIAVRVRDLAALGPLIDALIADGANSFRGLRFALQDPLPSTDAARRAAVVDARRKAEIYAAAAGVELGPILSIDEQGGVQPRMMRAEMAGLAADGGMPVAAGEMEIRSMVTVTWSLVQTD